MTYWYAALAGRIYPFKPEFTLVIFINYKRRIAVRLVVDEDDFDNALMHREGSKG